MTINVESALEVSEIQYWLFKIISSQKNNKKSINLTKYCRMNRIYVQFWYFIIDMEQYFLIYRRLI